MEDIKTLLKEHTEEIKRHTGELEQKFERHVDVLKEDFDEKVKLLTEQYDSIIQKLDSHDGKFASMEKNIEIIKVDIAFIKSGLKKKVDLEEFEALENRVALLEAKTRSG